MGKKSSFGSLLKAIREAKEMTQSRLATTAGFSREFIARLENDRQDPSWGTVKALASALQVDCTAFQEAPEPSPPAAKSVKPAAKGKRKGKGPK